MVSALSVSSACTHGAVGSTNSELLRWTAQDPPYPAAITITGSLAKGQLTLTGSSSGLVKGTKVSVYVKVLGKKGATFVKQKSPAVVGPEGRFTWKGATKAAQVAVYASSGATKSRILTLTSR